MSLILTNEQQCELTVAFTNAAGSVAPVEGAPAWAVADPAVLDLQAKADGMSAIVASKGMGMTVVTVTADADLGSGVTTITGELGVEVKAAEAVTVGIDAGTPIEQLQINPLKKT